MGGEAEVMAINAAFACDQLGAIAIDLNFGCPAKTVNRHMAGAALLQWPDKLYEITKAVNVALGGKIPLSAKMRLGFEDKSLAIENAKALEEAGAQKITVHARTKLEGYKPPAHWEWISRIRESVRVPVVANGEIWTKEDAVNCQKISGCKDIMIGRGAIARPSLAREIKGGEFAHWSEVLGWLIDYADMVLGQHTSKWSEGRLKQWIKQLGRTYEESTALFNEVRTVRDPLLIKQYIVDQYKSLNSF